MTACGEPVSIPTRQGRMANGTTRGTWEAVERGVSA